MDGECGAHGKQKILAHATVYVVHINGTFLDLKCYGERWERLGV